MTYVLLTGAGFTRNWGGWLADEAFEYLLGAPEVDDYLRNILWMSKLRGEGFENALSIVQGGYAARKMAEDKKRLDALTAALIGMFTMMQTAFSQRRFTDQGLLLQRFLAQFDAIFTLNQDTFLETHYMPPRWSERWYGSYLPYMDLIEQPSQPYPFPLRGLMTQQMSLELDENHQPVYKLHGSYNWFAEPNGERLLVMGGNKTGSIKLFPVLARYQEIFQATLRQADTKLMVIGYSFGDEHINKVIQDGVTTGLKIFVIDPKGVDVIDKRNKEAQIPEPATELMQGLIPGFIGASRRSVNDIIFNDLVENQKVMRFFDGQPQVIKIAKQPSATNL